MVAVPLVLVDTADVLRHGSGDPGIWRVPAAASAFLDSVLPNHPALVRERAVRDSDDFPC